MSAAPAISVVVASLGMHETLARVLDRYERQEAGDAGFELIIGLDQADPDPGQVERLAAGRPYECRIVRGAIPGASANRNAGVEAARAPIVLFTDNDTVPHRDLLRRHLEWHRAHPEPEVSVLGRVRWAPEIRVTAFMRWLETGLQFEYPRITGIEAGWGRYYTANVSSKVTLVERAGGFDAEHLPYLYEDIELGYRADRQGMRLLYNPDAVVDHLREATLEQWQQRIRRVARAERTFVTIHPEVEPYLYRIFDHVRGLPPARGRGRLLARWIPESLPVLGQRVWTSADLYYKQQLAPAFLQAWEETEGEAAGAP